MASTIESGHAKIVANFKNLIDFVKGYGVVYNPAKISLKVLELDKILNQAVTGLTDVITQNTAYNNQINKRQIAFADIKSLGTRLLNAFQTTDASEQAIQDVKGFNRKIQGQRVSKKNSNSTDSNGTVANSNSTSQQSYTQLIQHFAGLTAVLKSEPSYSPNETELQIKTLENKRIDLNSKNDAVNSAYVSLSNARIIRNDGLYNDPDSIIQVAAEIKKYIKSIFGATSPEFAQVKGIDFRNPLV